MAVDDVHDDVHDDVTGEAVGPAATWRPGDDPADCPVARFLGVLDGPWATLIVRELLAGPRRFTSLRDTLTGISPKTLTARLRSLEAAGVVHRVAYDESPPRVEYSLTSVGLELREVLDTMAAWSARNLPPDAARPRPVRSAPLRTR
jgi:DNA-binding HxlR family transcriptional regulator